MPEGFVVSLSSTRFLSLGLFTNPRSRHTPAISRDKSVKDPCDFSELDFLRTFGNAIAPVVSVNVLKRLVPRVAKTSMELHRRVGSLTNQSVGAVITHRHLVCELSGDVDLIHAVHLSCGFVD